MTGRADATVLSVFEHNTNGYMLMPPTFCAEEPNSLFKGNRVYIGCFKPQNGMWFGNLKRYQPAKGLGELLNQNGYFSAGVKSHWSSFADGSDFTKGGLAEILEKQFNLSAGNRNLFTFVENPGSGLPAYDLTDRSNSFDKNNHCLTASMLGVSEDFRDELIQSVRERGLGAIIHSRPLEVYYPILKRTVIFIGDNNGFLHCIDSLSGEELWAFVMPEHLKALKNAHKPLYNSFVDNTPVLYEGPQNQKILICGAGRGGFEYVALNISNLEKPVLMYLVEQNIMDEVWLGRSWGVPQITKIAGAIKGAGHIRNRDDCSFRDFPLTFRDVHDVVILPGGYDIHTGNLSENVLSRRGAVVAGLDPLTGWTDPAFALLNSKASPVMRYSVLDVLPMDLNRSGHVDSLFFGDTGGNLLFAAQYQPEPSGFICGMLAGSGLMATSFRASNQFVPYILFQTSPQTHNKIKLAQKIMFRPAVIFDKNETFPRILFGTGDRENPGEDKVLNKFYCLKFDSWQYLTYDFSELRHITEDQLADIALNAAQDGQPASRRKALKELEVKKGWMLPLAPGEKVVSSPVAYNGTVFFSTYTPTHKDRGLTVPAVARLYALDYKTGGAVFYWNKDANAPQGKITAAQRSKIIGFTMPSAPEIQIFRDRIALYVSVGDKIIELPLPGETLNSFYWREFY